MSIIRDLEIKISNGEAKLSEDVYVYQRDRGVELKLKLNMIEVNSNSNERSILFEVNNVFAAATILKPNGDVISRRKTIVANNTITFTIDEEFTDQVDEIGIYKIQFHLYDDYDSRITLPPIQFEVKELLGFVDEEDMNHQYGVADVTLSDYCMVADDGRVLEVFSNGKYIKTIWRNGDLITSAKLNKIEEAIGNLDSRFHIGGEPLHIDPVVWVDVPDLDSPYSMVNNSLYWTEPINEELPSEDIKVHSSFEGVTIKEILKNIMDKMEILEKKIESLENND